MRSRPIVAALALLGLAAAAAAQTTQPAPPPGSVTADEIGATLKRGAERLGTAAKDSALDLWEAGKAAYAAGARTLREREAARDRSPPPDLTSR